MSLAPYIKHAFTNRWNLLAFLGGVGFSLISPATAFFLPLVLAAEVGYLGFVGGNPRYKRLVDGRAQELLDIEKAQAASARLSEVLSALEPSERQRFDDLRREVIEARRLAGEIRRPEVRDADAGLDQVQLEGLDRLLWSYLRLLYTRQSLARFLALTEEHEIASDAEALKVRLEEIRGQEESLHRTKLEATVTDNLETVQQRLENHRQAKASFELLDLEVDRIENKMHTISEMAINRADPADILLQVDAVADSMIETEETMNELQFATNLSFGDEVVPVLTQAVVEA